MLSMLEEMLSSSQLTSKVRAFDLILNLGVHGHLLEPLLADDASTIEEEYTQEPYLDKKMSIKQDYLKAQSLSAINNFESWILCILYEVLLLLVQVISFKSFSIFYIYFFKGYLIKMLRNCRQKRRKNLCGLLLLVVYYILFVIEAKFVEAD